MAWKRTGAPCEFLKISFFKTAVDFRANIIPKEIDLRGREVSRGDGNLVSVEYESVLFFYSSTYRDAKSNCLGSMFSIVGIQLLGKDFLHENPPPRANFDICSKLDEEWIKHALEAALGEKKPDWDHASTPSHSLILEALTMSFF